MSMKCCQSYSGFIKDSEDNRTETPPLKSKNLKAGNWNLNCFLLKVFLEVIKLISEAFLIFLHNIYRKFLSASVWFELVEHKNIKKLANLRCPFFLYKRSTKSFFQLLVPVFFLVIELLRRI